MKTRWLIAGTCVAALGLGSVRAARAADPVRQWRNAWQGVTGLGNRWFETSATRTTTRERTDTGWTWTTDASHTGPRGTSNRHVEGEAVKTDTGLSWTSEGNGTAAGC